ncbi:MAG: bacteriophage abortive infection AbiH family protein [Bacteroidota bacterium]
MPENLYIIGNGFDLHHGVMSGYEDFREYLSQVDRGILKDLNTFLACKNLWGDFENNLAYLSRERLLEEVDMWLPKLEPDDDTFSAADFEIALEQATGRVWSFTEGLKYRFHKWIRTLYLPKGHKWKTLELDRSAAYITFNYTDFLESLYEIPSSQIIYLHGNRNNKTGSLILGHGQNPDKNFEEWFHKNRNKKRFRAVLKNRQGNYFPNHRLTYLAYFNENEVNGNWQHSTRYYAVDRVVGEIEKYYEESGKNFNIVLKKHDQQFRGLKDIKKIIVMGHSLSAIDIPYFKKIYEENENPQTITWEISYFSDSDKININRFLKVLQIERSTVSLFQLTNRQINK